MIEILGKNLKKFFDIVDNPPNDAEITYAGNRYEVWEVSDKLFENMCSMTEEEFINIAGEDAWWRQSDGSSLGYPDDTTIINGRELICWSKERVYPSYDYASKEMKEYNDLSEYLCDCIGASQPRNVCACAMDLAKYNDMSMGELFEKYEG